MRPGGSIRQPGAGERIGVQRMLSVGVRWPAVALVLVGSVGGAFADLPAGSEAPTAEPEGLVRVEELMTKGDYGSAETFYRRALSLRDKVLGGEHPEVTTSLNNLAMLQVTMDRPANAEPRSSAVLPRYWRRDWIPIIRSSWQSARITNL